VTDEELQLLLQAACVAKLDPSQLKPINPFTQQGGVARTMQSAVEQVNPSIAARWRVEAGETLSLQAAAAKQGIAQLTNAAHSELMTLDSSYREQHQQNMSKRESELLESMEKGAERLAEARGIRRHRMEETQRNAGRNLARRGGW